MSRRDQHSRASYGYPTRPFIQAMRELLDTGALGSWRWLSMWRRSDRLWNQVLTEKSSSAIEIRIIDDEGGR